MSGVPLPLALPIAMDPQTAQAGLVEGARVFEQGANTVLNAVASPGKAKRKVSAYNRKYKAAFKKVASQFKLKNGNWKSNGFRSAVRAAHKMAGGKK